MHKVGNQRNGERTIQEGYRQLVIPGEGTEVHERMGLAIKNYAMNYGLFNVTTISPEEYNKVKGIK